MASQFLSFARFGRASGRCLGHSRAGAHRRRPRPECAPPLPAFASLAFSVSDSSRRRKGGDAHNSSTCSSVDSSTLRFHWNRLQQPLTQQHQQCRRYSRGKDHSLDVESRRSLYQSAGKIEKSVATVKMAIAGGVVIFAAKAVVWLQTGSSSMLAEAIHSIVDGGNQALLLYGLRASSVAPDTMYQYGYGKSLYFWSLVSALGIFYCGAGGAFAHSFDKLMHANTVLEIDSIGPGAWIVLAVSLAVDGYVLHRSVQQINENRAPGVSFLQHLRKVRDPATLSILFEDAAACAGVLVATAGIGLSQMTLNPLYDAMGGMVVAGLLAGVGLVLARVNHSYLIGKSVEAEVVDDICSILLKREGIDNVKSVQSQYIGPYTFSFKAELDFDGTCLAAQLIDRYEPYFKGGDLSRDLHVLLALYAEDVARVIEREVMSAEAAIRSKYPEAAFIELEPDSSKAFSFAVDDMHTATIVNKERAAIQKLLVTFALSPQVVGEGAGDAAGGAQKSGDSQDGSSSGTDSPTRRVQ